MNIFIVGMPGSGKTFLGEEVSIMMGQDFYDTDHLIEKEFNQPLKELLETHKNIYRAIESKTITSIIDSNKEDCIISTGGGLPCHNSNMDLMNKHGHTIYLDVSKEELKKRLLNSDLTNRPFITGDIDKYLETTIRQREIYYKKATKTLSGDNISFDDLEDCIKEIINHRQLNTKYL